MHPFLRVHPLTEEEYTQLRKMFALRERWTERAKRAQIILLSNQGYLPGERSLSGAETPLRLLSFKCALPDLLRLL